MLPRFMPANFYDPVIEVAIVRGERAEALKALRARKEHN